MDRKALMVATVASTIGQFNMNNIKILQNMGFEVHVACDFEDQSVWTRERVDTFLEEMKCLGVSYYQIDFSRNPISVKKHLTAYKQLKKIFADNQYEFVHCHTPVASAICRMVAHKMNTKCIYTAHGFHFYKGAPLKNWLIFYPIEKVLSRWTDVLITINREDYRRAEKQFHAKHTEYVPGVGIDIKKINSEKTGREDIRRSLGVSENDIVLLSVGELSPRKNHEVIIRAIQKIDNRNIKYFICGQGNLEEKLKILVHELGLDRQVQLLGFRTDVYELYHAADLFVFPSFQEGLPVALMEAMACDLPCVVSNIRGNNDLIEDGINGYLCPPDDVAEFVTGIEKLINNGQLRKQFSQENRKKIKDYDIRIIDESMRKIYSYERTIS